MRSTTFANRVGQVWVGSVHDTTWHGHWLIVKSTLKLSGYYNDDDYFCHTVVSLDTGIATSASEPTLMPRIENTTYWHREI